MSFLPAVEYKSWMLWGVFTGTDVNTFTDGFPGFRGEFAYDSPLTLNLKRPPPAKEEKKGIFPPNTNVDFKVSWGASVYLAGAAIAAATSVAM